MIKSIIFLFTITWLSNAQSTSLSEIDNDINKLILSALTLSTTRNKTDETINTCQYIENKALISSLITCHEYLSDVYVTEDIDSYSNYINKLLQFGVRVQDQPEFNKIISAGYEEVTSKLFFKIAEMSYKYKRYDDALKYLKKIDDSLDDQSVYSALLMYGLIYFEKGDYKKAKYYFSRIDDSSEMYLYAKYNLALISMRSSWWSEAEDHLNDAIKVINLKKIDKKHSQVLDKIYLTIGYSQLNRKNYRLSKQSFSKISINSNIQSRALIGLSMSEIGLNNLNKAAPILKHILNNVDNDDYLDALVILPQVYQHADNLHDTVNYYNDALSKMSDINSQVNELINKVDALSMEEMFDLTPNQWRYEEIKNRYLSLGQFESLQGLQPADYKKVASITNKTIKYTRNMFKRELIKKVKKINNYVTQVKYSLAVIYDSSVADNQ